MQFGASMMPMVPMMPTGGDFTRSVSTGAMPAMGGMAMDGGWGSTGLPWETNIPGGAFAGLPFNLGTMGGMPTFGLPSFANASAPGNSGIYCEKIFPILTPNTISDVNFPHLFCLKLRRKQTDECNCRCRKQGRDRKRMGGEMERGWEAMFGKFVLCRDSLTEVASLAASTPLFSEP